MKVLKTLVTVLAIGSVLMACGNNTTTVDLKAADMVDSMVKSTQFVDEMIYLKENAIYNLYQAVEQDKIDESAVYVGSSGATAEEIAVFKLKDKQEVSSVKTAIEKHIDDQKTAFENYIPEEMPKLNSAQILSKDRYIAVIVADDTTAAVKVFNDLF